MTEQISLDGEKCPLCGEGKIYSLFRTEDFDFDLGHEGVVKVHAENVPVEKCDKCGEVLIGPAAARVEHEAICRAAGILLPSEIMGIREKLGWTQDCLASLTGFLVETISLWERGRRLQNRWEDNFLRLLRDSPASRDFLEERHRSTMVSDEPIIVPEQKVLP